MMLRMEDEIKFLQLAAQRCARFSEWAKQAKMPNVGKDATEAQKEIESVIYSLQERQKLS